MFVKKEVRIPMLLDFYGNLLSETQRHYLDLYYNEDLSLSEISDNVGKSRQGICESIKRAESILINSERKLGFLKKSDELNEDLAYVENFLIELKNNPKVNFENKFKQILCIFDKYKNE